MSRITLFCLTFLTITACSSTTSGNSGFAGCVPNATQLCYCAVGVQGLQLCQANGAGWSLCNCGGAVADASTTDGTNSSDSAGLDAKSDAKDSGGAAGADAGKDALLDTAVDAGTTVEDTASGESDVDWSELLDPEDSAAPADSSTTGGGGGTDDCPERAKIIYVVTESNQLLSFSPDKLQFKTVGTLKCPPSVGSQPFSMAVDRQANAFVLYQSGFGSGGGVCKVSTLDAKGQATNYISGIQGFELFGMGFSSNQPALPEETLWIGGAKASSYSNAANTCYLGYLDMTTMQPVKVGAFPAGWGCPEMTGNSMAELYGFFPSANPPAVAKLDKSTAQVIKAWPLPAAFSGGMAAWAFAQWGGQLYLFFKGISDPSTNVWTLDTKNGNVVKVLPNIGQIIVGAGVSSCAPASATSP